MTYNVVAISAAQPSDLALHIIIYTLFFNIPFWTSLAVQWLRIHLPRQGTQVRPWSVKPAATSRGATKLVATTAESELQSP